MSIALFGDGIAMPKSFHARFIQKVTNPKQRVIEYRGTVSMNYPDRMKWHYDSPTVKDVCSSGKRIMVVDHDLEQVSNYRMDESFDLSEVLKKAKFREKNLYLAIYRGKYYTIALDEKGRIEQIAYRDDMDNIVHIRFVGMKYGNRALDRKKLMCTIPKNYDIVGE
jgi:outer membrane lipoprotein-sorting protein